MGIFDKAKQIADNAKSIAQRASEIRNTPEVTEEVIILGTIRGDSFPKSPQGEEVAYLFDVSEKKLIVYYSVSGMLKTTHKLVAEYSLDDIVEFRTDKIDFSDSEDFPTTYYRNLLVLSSGETLRAVSSVTTHLTNITEFKLKQDYKDLLHLNILINSFINKIRDDKTKQWINEFYQRYKVDAPFDEEGNLDLTEFIAKSNKLSSRLEYEYEKRRKEVVSH